MKYATDTLTIEHKHGRLVLEAVTDVRPVRGLRCTDLPEVWRFAGLDTAERLAVLCEDHRVQLCIAYPFEPGNPGFVFLHDSASTGRVMRVAEMEWTGPDAGAVIRAARLWERVS